MKVVISLGALMDAAETYRTISSNGVKQQGIVLACDSLFNPAHLDKTKFMGWDGNSQQGQDE